MATGPDQIPPKLIKIARPQISNVLTRMINNAIDEGIFPDSLKRAQVTPGVVKAVKDTLLALVEKWKSTFRKKNVLGPFLWISAKRLTVCIMIC